MSRTPVRSSAGTAILQQWDRRKGVREFVTPEGVDLSLEIANVGQRVGGLVLDVIIMIAVLAIATLILVFAASGTSPDLALIVWLLGGFLLRNFWFVMFELGPRAATPGKRIAGTRVVARDGGRLTVSAVVARNLVREVEIFLPLTFIISAKVAGDTVEFGIAAFGILWTCGLGFFLLFNRDRMRLGDLVGGTWVVQARRKRIAADLSSSQLADAPGAPVFTPQELSFYGVFELQQLERVLREGNRDTMIAVADTIRAKMGRTLQEEDRVFLIAYYRQLKARMERDLLFGKRRANKYEALE